MEFDLRDWLLILGPVFVSGVLIHGYWRMRRGKGDLKMSLDKSFLGSTKDEETVDDLSFFKAELPNGGARVIPGEAISALDSDELDLSNNVPVLLEPIAVNESVLEEKVPEEKVPEEKVPEEKVREEKELDKSAISERAIGEDEIVSPSDDRQIIDPDVLVSDDASSTPDEESVVAKAPTARRTAPLEKPEMFIVINVLADDEFDGQVLLEALTELNMTFGEMDIFHRMAQDESTEFSLVNVVEPGTFNPVQMDQLKTPGVTLFMRAHELHNPIRVYDAMIDTAQKLADELGGELRDQSKSVMTSQTIEHLRQGIQDFQYKHSA